MTKNLKIYAGVSILAGAAFVGGIALNPDLPRNVPQERETIVAEENIPVAVMPVKMELEDGHVGYAVPDGYYLYQIDKNINSPEKLNITFRDGYVIYSYYLNEYGSCSLDGYICVKSEYKDSLRQLDYMKEAISLGNPEYTTKLVRLAQHDVIVNPYFLSDGYTLYDLNESYEEDAFSYVKEEDGIVYELSDDVASHLVGVTNSVYQTIQQLESLENSIEDIYEQGYEKTNSRS